MDQIESNSYNYENSKQVVKVKCCYFVYRKCFLKGLISLDTNIVLKTLLMQWLIVGLLVKLLWVLCKPHTLLPASLSLDKLTVYISEGSKAAMLLCFRHPYSRVYICVMYMDKHANVVLDLNCSKRQL